MLVPLYECFKHVFCFIRRVCYVDLPLSLVRIAYGFIDDTKRVTSKATIQMQADHTMIRQHRTLYQLTVDDPTEHVKISLNLNPP
jgi:hypothetical protein